MRHDTNRAAGQSTSGRARRWLRRLATPRSRSLLASTVDSTISVREELETLRSYSYIVMHDFMFGDDETVDHMVSGPNGVFMIETKFSHYDDVHLAKAKRQARKLHDELGCWVTPVICPGVRKNAFTHKGVLIAGRGLLADAIRAQPRHRGVEADRLARFADRLD
jgi:hypothetical protein